MQDDVPTEIKIIMGGDLRTDRSRLVMTEANASATLRMLKESGAMDYMSVKTVPAKDEEEVSD